MQNAVRPPKSSAFSLPAVYSREAEWLSRLCMPAGVLRMRIFYGGRVRFCVCRPPKSKKRRFTLTSCVFCRVRAWMFRHSRQLAPKGHRTAARRRKLAQPRRRKPRYVMGNRLLFHFRLCTAGRQGAACQKILHSEGTGVRVPSPPASAPHDSTHTPLRRRIGMHQNIHGAEKSRK